MRYVSVVIALVWLTVIGQAQMFTPFYIVPPVVSPVVFGIEDSVSVHATSATVTQSFTITDADLLVVGTTMTFTSPSDVTFNGVSLTQQVAREYSGFGSFIYTMANPPAGTYNVVVTPNYGANEVCVTIASFKKTHNSTPVSGADYSEGNDTAPSISISSTTGEIVFAMLCWNIDGASSVTPDGGQIEIAQQTEGSYNGASASRKAGAASTTLSWTIPITREWAVTGLSIKPE